MLLFKETEVAGSIYRKEFLARLVPNTGIDVKLLSFLIQF